MEEKGFPEEKKEIKRLYRSRKNRVIGGVCGGLANYFEVDVVVIRILFILFALIKGIGLLIYLVALVVVPVNANGTSSSAPEKKSTDRSQAVIMIIGIMLVLFGVYYLLENLSIFPHYWFDSFLFHFRWELFWPVLLILIGILYLVRVIQKPPTQRVELQKEEPPMSKNEKRLFRSRKERKISGVCGGLAAYLQIDPTIVRVLWIILTIISSFFLGIVVYIVMAIVVPEGDYVDQHSSANSTGGHS